MIRYEKLVSALTILFAVHCVAGAQSKFRGSFSDAVDHVLSNDRLRAKKVLDRIPDAELVQEGLAFLRKSSTLSDEVRQFCFQALATNGAATTEEGYRLFIDGLLDSDPSVQRWSVAGLASVPQDRREETVGHFVRVLTRTDTAGSENVIRQALGILQRWGSVARPLFPFVEQEFRRADATRQTRELAALAMLKIGPASRAIGQFTKDDLVVVIEIIAGVGAETNGTFNGADAATLRRIRNYVRSALDHEDPEVRRQAITATLYAYGRDFVVGNKKEGYHVNPEVIEALQTAARDPDERVRQMGNDLLATLDRRLKNAIRRREKREAQVNSGNGPDK